MKKLFLALTVVLVAFASCKKDEPKAEIKPQAKEAYVNSSSFSDWQYVSLATGKVVGTAPDPTGKDLNEEWAKRKDWDIAFKRSNIRTNSGKGTTAGAKGGVFVLDAAAKFDAINELPKTAVFETDQQVKGMGMTGPFTTVMSKAVVATMKKGANGNVIMPPEYLVAPICVFKNAAGDKTYKVSFVSYVNDEGKGGHIKMMYAEIK